jgi:hypothetical protein
LVHFFGLWEIIQKPFFLTPRGPPGTLVERILRRLPGDPVLDFLGVSVHSLLRYTGYDLVNFLLFAEHPSDLPGVFLWFKIPRSLLFSLF